MIGHVGCYFRSSRYLRTTGSRSKPTIERIAFLTCNRQRTDCSVIREVRIFRSAGSAISGSIPRHSILTRCLVELSSISSLANYSNNCRRPCIVKYETICISRILRRGITAIYRCFSVCHLIGLQGRTVAVNPRDCIFAFSLVVISDICLRALHFGEGCRSPTRKRIGPFCILFARIIPSIRRGLTVFQLQIVEHGLAIIIHKRNLIFLGCLIVLRNIGLVALDLCKAVAACALEPPAGELERVGAVVRFVRVFGERSNSSQIGRVRRCTVICHFRRSQQRHIVVKERDRVRTRMRGILRGICSRTAYRSNRR